MSSATAPTMRRNAPTPSGVVPPARALPRSPPSRTARPRARRSRSSDGSGSSAEASGPRPSAPPPPDPRAATLRGAYPPAGTDAFRGARASVRSDAHRDAGGFERGGRPSTVDERRLLDVQARHGQALFGFALRLSLSEDAAADAVQETLLRLWRELGRGTPIEVIRRPGRPDDLPHRDGSAPISSEDRRADSTTSGRATCTGPRRWRRPACRLGRGRSSTRASAAGALSALSRRPAVRWNREVLGIMPGAARTLASRGLDRLRERLGTGGA